MGTESKEFILIQAGLLIRNILSIYCILLKQMLHESQIKIK